MISRRALFRTVVGGGMGLLLAPSRTAAFFPVRIDEGPHLPRPTAAQLRWQNAEIGLIYHFDLPIAARRFAPNNTVRERISPEQYRPAELDTDQWIEAAKAAGATYALFTATHFNGFMQWQSDLYPYGLKQTSWRGGNADVVGDFVASCRRAGIMPGLYLSTHRNAYWTVSGHYVDWGEGRGTEKQARFNAVAEKMTEELCSRYGPLIQIWFDAGVKTPAQGGPDVLPVFERYQPDSVFYHNLARSDIRWIGNERGYADYPCWATMPSPEVSHKAEAWKPILATGDPTGDVWSPGMVDVPLRGANGVHNWFWHPGQDHAAHDTEALVQMYYDSVGRNCNFVIGAVVTPEGLVPDSDIERLAAFGRAVRHRFDRPVGETQGAGTTLELDLPRTQRIDHVVLEEDIAHGERVRRYAVDGLVSEGNWQALCEGQSIGHKRIERFAFVKVARIRFRATQADAVPKLRRFAAFSVAAEE